MVLNRRAAANMALRPWDRFYASLAALLARENELFLCEIQQIRDAPKAFGTAVEAGEIDRLRTAR
jgi:hypothetical protein